MTAYDVASRTLLVLIPEFLVILSATVMMTAGAFVRLPRRTWCAIAAGTLVLALVALIGLRHSGTEPYGSIALNDALSGYARLFFLLTGLLILAMAHDQVDDARAPEFFGCLLMIHAGAMLVASANELVFLFVGLELVSIPTYLLLYLSRRNLRTLEAATKYFFLSVFSSGLLLYGLAFLYGLTGVSHLKALAYFVHFAPNVPQPQFGLIAVVFIVAGLGFRVAAVPFHFYAPDVYEGSPLVVTALLAWIPKGIGFLAMIRVLTSVFAPAGADSPVVGKAIALCWIIAAVTMTLGNTVALQQKNLQRLFAYSSIAHAGYLMIGVAVAFRNTPGTQAMYLGTEGILFYLFAYALMTLGAFAIIIGLSTTDRPVETIDDLAGLAKSHPGPALAMAICLFSLAGIPPLAGFWGKFELFASAFAASPPDESRAFQALALIGVLNSAAGAYYYLRIVVEMYLKPASSPLIVHIKWPTAAAIGACATLTVAFGLDKAPIDRAVRESALAAADHPVPAPALTATASIKRPGLPLSAQPSSTGPAAR